MQPYAPSNTLVDKISRRIRPLRNTRKLAIKLDKPLISISFDDFPVTAITNGSDVMEQYGWRATFYTCAGLEGITNHHGQHFRAEHLLKLQAAGHEIAGHTLDHQDCSVLSDDAVLTQIEKNKARLCDIGITQSIDGFAYPFGAATAPLKKLLSHKFEAIRGIKTGQHTHSADLNELKSCGVYSSTIDNVIARINALPAAPAWLTLFTHDICDAPSPWGCTPAEFIRVLDAIAASRADVLPVREAVHFLRGQHDQ